MELFRTAVERLSAYAEQRRRFGDIASGAGHGLVDGGAFGGGGVESGIFTRLGRLRSVAVMRSPHPVRMARSTMLRS